MRAITILIALTVLACGAIGLLGLFAPTVISITGAPTETATALQRLPLILASVAAVAAGLLLLAVTSISWSLEALQTQQNLMARALDRIEKGERPSR